MQYKMKRLFLLLLGACLWMAEADAQPARRRVQPQNSTSTQAKPASGRAELQFPASVAMPEDVVWRRDIYRQLDLMLDKNAPLYYPVEPTGRQVNLFTYVFRLLLTGRIDAYAYQLDGNESFASKDKVDIKDIMDRYHIYYEEKDGSYTVNNNDIPSAEVTRYYLKESIYFDQRTSTFQTKVTALCPVLMRGADDFGSESTPYPLFWLKYDDVASYLSKLPMMGSNLNNVTNLTADDYFTLNRYEGKIYKTNNLQGKVLANYCKTDSALAKEQRRIETQITDFEKNIWRGMPEAAKDSTDSVAVEKEESKAVRRSVRRETTETTARSRRSAVKATADKGQKQKSKSSGASAPRVSVRRQRR